MENILKSGEKVGRIQKLVKEVNSIFLNTHSSVIARLTKAAEAISPLVSLRGAEGDEAISVGTGDCHASLARTKASLSTGDKSPPSQMAVD